MPALDGMRVLDLTQFEAGPSCTQQLAWLGADVVKVERPGSGDPGRHTEEGHGDSIYFLSHNSNKRSVAIDLGSEDGRGLFLKLLPRFDVVVENFTVGTMERLGLGYEVLKSVHPSIIYATIKGFGLTGPYAGFKCYDMVAQAVGGVFSVTGEPDGPPMRAGPSLSDTTSGMTLALGIVSAYVQRLRTGNGQLVEVSMQEAVLNLMRTRFSQREVTGDPVPRRGNHLVPPSDLYPCAPGGPNDYIIMHFVMERMYDAFAIAIDRPDLTTDPRFSTQAERRKHRDELFAEVSAWTLQRTKYEAMEILGAAGVPCGAVLDSGDILHDRHLRVRDSITTVHHPVRGDWEFPAPPLRMSESRVEVEPSPLLGANTEEVLLQELGITTREATPLHEQSVL